MPLPLTLKASSNWSKIVGIVGLGEVTKGAYLPSGGGCHSFLPQ